MNMRAVSAWAVMLWSLSLASSGAAQETAAADSLVAGFIEKGLVAEWRPDLIFQDCEQLDEVDQRALELLLAADLSRQRADDLAFAWRVVLEACQPPAVVDWFLAELEADVRQGRDAKSMHILWRALELASSPRVRSRLREYVLDTTLPEEIRVAAGRSMFEGAGVEGKREEFTMVFQSGDAPVPLANQMGFFMMRYDTDWTLRETARLVSDDPQLVEQVLFGQVVVSSRDAASRGQRDDLAGALEEIAERASVSEERRGFLIGIARDLRGGGG